MGIHQLKCQTSKDAYGDIVKKRHLGILPSKKRSFSNIPIDELITILNFNQNKIHPKKMTK